MKAFAGFLSIAVVVLTAGCGQKALPLNPVATSGSALHSSSHPNGIARAAATFDTPQHLEGVAGPGALYVIDVPAGWNGDLVLYAHGYSNPALSIALPSIDGLRGELLGRGFAVAVSSYSQNGYALKQGVEQVHQLGGIFADAFGAPNRTFLIGVSLGGQVVQMLAEKYPSQYNGALIVSGVVGGTKAEIDYIADVRVVFDCLYPGVVPGSLLDVPENVNLNAVVGSVVQTIQAHPQPIGLITQISRIPVPYASSNELVTSVLSAIGFQLQGIDDFYQRTHGHVFFDNSNVTYGGPLPAAYYAGLNGCVARYQSTPDAENVLEHWYEPSGDLRIPVITLHTTRDPVVPIFHEALWHDKVVAAGHADKLLQRTTGRYGHVAYTPAELATNFVDLIGWADTGVKPAN
jgi:pimeloyl-ACP methyl ester carboxylesterase